jgi:low temperature requirement protein LtrA
MLFAVAYLVVQLWVLAMQGHTAWPHPAHRASWVRYASAAVVAPILLVVGASADGSARTAWWVGAVVVNIASSILAGMRRRDEVTEWRINPTHFSERHSLFVIICLGETLVAIGATATRLSADAGIEGAMVVSIVCCVAVAALMWWVYFNWIPRVGEHALAERTGGERARMARDLFTLIHFPIVFGIVLFAVVAKHVIEHPTDPLEVADRWLLATSMALFIGGLLLTQFRIVRALAPERVVAIAVVALIASGLTFLSGSVVMVLVALTLAAMHAITWRNFRDSEFGARVFAS